MENKMIQELVSPTKNHIFELNNKIKVLDNKIYDLEKDIVNRDTLLKLNIEKLSIIIANGGHDYVEIAGIKWATMNVGANDVTDYGKYFQWGDTSGYTKDEIEKEHKKKFASDWSDYTKFTTNGGSTFMKYNETGMTLDLDDDAVHAAWGGSWRMPTKGEMQTVLKSTAVTTGWTDNYNNSGVAGMVLTDKNSNETLFFPACGYACDGSVDYVGSYGYYWLSSLDTGGVRGAYELGFGSGNASVGVDNRYEGLCVRGVLAEN